MCVFGCGGQDLNLRPSGYEPEKILKVHYLQLQLTPSNNISDLPKAYILQNSKDFGEIGARVGLF